MKNKNLEYNNDVDFVLKDSFKAPSRFFRYLLYLMGSALLFILACWFSFETSYSAPIKYTVLILLFIALTPMLQRVLLLSYLKLERAWIYRYALLASVSLGIVLWDLHFYMASADFSFWLLASVLLGAFLGGLAVTSLDCGLFEINGSPSKSVKEEVCQHHLEMLGELPSEPCVKRMFDISFAVISIVIWTPSLILIILLIWWEDPGPIFFIKNSVGRNGINFRQFKFRTMMRDAERTTGPILASKNDSRILQIGKLLRLTALDEFPQFINILRGDMSLVGPRPQRTILVHNYLKKIPQYALRHAVRPGLAGLAQVTSHYHITPIQKLRFDRLYVRSVSFWLDLKLILSAVLIVFFLRFQNGWDLGGDYSKILRNYRKKMDQLFKVTSPFKRIP